MTGSSALAAEAIESLKSQTHEIIAIIAKELTCAPSLHSKVHCEPARLRIISPLGEGADRLIASVALDLASEFNPALLTTEFSAVLPFAQGDYEATFSKDEEAVQARSVDAFRALLAKAEARVLELDGAPAPDMARAHSYESMGRFVVRNSDLLIAIWDDQVPPRGRGGTRDTLFYALSQRVPVLWIHASGRHPPRWLGELFDLHSDRATLDGDLPKLQDYLRAMLHPPKPLGRSFDPLVTYLQDKERKNAMIWRAHSRFVGSIRKWGGRWHRSRQADTAKAPIPLVVGVEPLADPSQSSRAATLARKYQERYRASYLLIFVFGTIALAAAVTGLVFGRAELVASWVELLTLVGIASLLIVNKTEKWHERYVSYRLLAELFRLHNHLDILGTSIPGTRISRAAQDHRDKWVLWFFAACVRNDPLPTGKIDANGVVAKVAKVRDKLLRDQIRFHSNREVECHGAAQILGGVGTLLFVLTFVTVVVKLTFLHMELSERAAHGLSFVTVLLPGASAALFGIRAYEEFETLSEQSTHMLEELNQLDSKFATISVDQPAALQTVIGLFHELAILLLSDLSGWAQLFRLKAVEA